ncbi:glycoside hydrolase family 66 protein [Clostridium sp. JN-9]|uniref:glycoside hydrolase family 66 protein n=1 Tax=Clostridium sp. JN-9 TaxID=2507159 RepID=UPI001FA9C197|nr:glycoside hydrolase family 66 protein [Clostridium sp. JN-9]
MYNLKKRIILSAFIVMLIGAAAFAYKYTKSDKNLLTSTGKLISDVYTDKARYSPSDKVIIKIDLNNNLNKDYSGTLNVYFKYLNNAVETKQVKVDVKKGEKKSVDLSWNAPKDDYKGYIVQVNAKLGFSTYDNKTTAVDVSSTWDKFPRYGYIAEYPKQAKTVTQDKIDWINKFHINGLQFYDWQNKHQKPLPGDLNSVRESWKDIANRDIYFQTVKDYIDSAHSKNIKAANYNLIYGAYTDYEKDGIKPEWGIYKDTQHSMQDIHPLPSAFASSIAIFNPANKDWQNYIFNAEKNVNKVLNFDIYHMDTLGNRNGSYDYNGEAVNLPDTYTDFINNAKKALGVSVIFNTVNCYGMDQVSKSNVDVLYSELWPSDYPSYYSFKEVIDKGYQLTDGKKNTVIAAYMNYNRAGFKGEFNENSVRLTDAAIFAAGGDHLEIGDTGMLSREYFPNKNLSMPKSLVAAMRNYYDFIVAYENLLRDGLKDIKGNIQLKGIKTSNNGDKGTVWTYAKEKKGYEVIQMVNLLGMKYSSWRDDGANYDAPDFQKNLKLEYNVNQGNVKGVYMASPDFNGGNSISLKYKVKKEGQGSYLEIEVPELQYWDMVYIEKE